MSQTLAAGAAAAPSVRHNGAADHGLTTAVLRPYTTRDQPAVAADGPGRNHQRRGQRLAAAALAVPLVLVNAAAVYGQAGWAYERLAQIWILAGLFAAAIESIGVYLAVEAHAALMAGDASARLRLGSYAVGGLVGALNYAHFAGPGGKCTALAVAFGGLSAVSPWLWAIRSKSINRAELRRLGLVDPRAVRFAPLRWTLYPVRTYRAFRAAVWAGITSPAEAIELTEPDGPDDAAALDHLAWIEAGRLLGSGQHVSRDTLALAIRARGASIANARAGELARRIMETEA